MISLENYLSSSDSEEENNDILRKRMRDSSNPLELPTTTFIRIFRLNKEAFTYVLNKTESFFKKTKRCSSIPTILKLAATFRFFAEGGYQKGIGQDFTVAMCQSKISMVLEETINILEDVICPRWISYILTASEKQMVKSYFFEKYGFPGVIGCIDGTHIRIISPSENKHLFFNRKGYNSINAMIVCDHEMKILCIDARYGGASHDSHVWNLSDLRRYLIDSRNPRERNWLLGDSGYPNEPWLITPFRSAAEGSREAQFNKIHSKCRNTVERSIGLLKARFRCLLSARELHYEPKKAVKIINVCAALHSICIHYKVENNEVREENVTSSSSGSEGFDELEFSSHTSHGEDVRNIIFNSIIL